MRKIAIIALSLFTAAAAQAQTTSGKVSYKETIKLDIALDGEMAQFAAMLPKEQAFNKTLYFSPDASLYQFDKAPENQELDHTEGNATIKIKMDRPEEKTYTDIKGKKKIEQKEFMTRKFLVTSDIGKTDWKLTGKQKTILGYPSQEARMKKDTTEIVAWFTPAIPVSTGPMGMTGLPGLILEVNYGKLITMEATNVTAMAVDKSLLVKPKDGKKVTEDEMEAIIEEKTKEMQQQYGGDGKRVIIKMER